MITETSAIQFGTTRLEYGIRRSSRRRTVAIAVDPEDGVLCTAPEHVSVAELDQVVRKKASWILERVRWTEQPEAPLPPRTFVSGESFWYLGRQYGLDVESPGETASVKLTGRYLTVTPEAASPDRAASIRGALETWYRARAAERLPERVALWRPKLQVPDAGDVLVRAQQKRWASCDTTGNLRFNWRIIQAPMRLVDYVVAHELTHLVYPDHTPDFWRRLGSAMADYETRKEDLRLMGPRLEW